uniref:Uncharacterized protein n=1 Tax=uncultured marine virus TaxID=186617 RepID=A0A0F7L4Q5_9VIRU|nr:hypothetical protein [uncultured marine virus]
MVQALICIASGTIISSSLALPPAVTGSESRKTGDNLLINSDTELSKHSIICSSCAF